MNTLERIETEKVESMKGRVEREKKKVGILDNEIKFNQEKIVEIEHQYNEDLTNQTAKQKQQKDELDAKRKLLLVEIEEIERRLQIKKLELEEISENIGKAESSIDNIRKGFEVEYRKIVGRKDKLQDMVRERD